MKDLDNFRYLPIKEKKGILDTEGKNICSLNSHGLTITLYCLHNHFVEVFQEGNKLVGVRILEDKKRLRFYARNLDLRFLLNQSILSLFFMVGQAHQELIKYAA
ncbi:MAG: hypothetical protein K0Q95_3038 [Bacteroidota bacterium]|jgi:hypothetical protein|nr:hypothetical protein [Bacteroidota bacterium]